MFLSDAHTFASSAVCLLIGAAGWYYLFYSRAAHKLGFMEATNSNQRRIVLRRFNGVLMILLAVVMYVLAISPIPERRPGVGVALLFTVIVLLGLCVSLAWIDMRMTIRLRQRRQEDRDRRQGE